MANPKAVLRTLIEAIGDRGALALARLAARRGARRIVMLDIDNTLADSWPTFLVPHGSERERLASIAPLPGMKLVTHDRALAEGSSVIFVSHRNLWHYPVTARWLREQGYAVSPLNLLLVSSAARKPAIARVLAAGRELIVWDDLSAGHESGTVRHYDDVRAEFEAVATRYFGADSIAEVVAGALRGNEAS
ncbi:MAG: hypothetical protein GX868_17455 [Actinobacteria bacterium]|nr:hypothetical protein [Actinomycetota bacterium]